MGFTVYPSYANFILATHKDMKAKYIFEKLKEKNIYVRYFKLPRIDNCLRITIGTDEQMDKMIDEIKRL